MSLKLPSRGWHHQGGMESEWHLARALSGWSGGWYPASSAAGPKTWFPMKAPSRDYSNLRDRWCAKHQKSEKNSHHLAALPEVFPSPYKNKMSCYDKALKYFFRVSYRAVIKLLITCSSSLPADVNSLNPESPVVNMSQLASLTGSSAVNTQNISF